ncbi:MAG: AbrB/MazE/SpoVT family DNA-binding domain-containing protein [Aestuariivirga sp.]
MNKPLTIRKVGNSLSLTISDMAKDLGLGEGDKVYAVRTPRGFELTPYDASFDSAVETARQFMRKYPNAMKKLAE